MASGRDKPEVASRMWKTGSGNPSVANWKWQSGSGEWNCVSGKFGRSKPKVENAVVAKIVMAN